MTSEICLLHRCIVGRNMGGVSLISKECVSTVKSPHFVHVNLVQNIVNSEVERSCKSFSLQLMIRCTLNGHEFPCNLQELQNFTKGKKYEKLSAAAEFNYSQYEPHIVPSTKKPNQLFCKLTLRHLNRQPHHILRHVNGKRFKKALSKYEECVQNGVEFIPIRLTQKKPRGAKDEVNQGRVSKHGGGGGNSMWEPASSDKDQSDSEDSMSDLYPPHIFTLKNPIEENMEGDSGEEEDDFQTDDDEEMEVDKQVMQKRKKVQGGGFQKKFRNSRWKSGRKKRGKV